MQFYKEKKEEENKYLDRFEELRKLAESKRNDLRDNQKLNPDIDIRLRFFNLMNQNLIFYNLNLFYHLECLIKHESLNKIIPVPDIITANVISDDYITFNNKNLIYNTSCFIEAYFRSILNTINGEYYRGQFRDLRSKIFKIAELKNNTDYWNALTILFNTRNGIHNNGIYIANNKKYEHIRIQYRNETSIFEHGFPMFGMDFRKLTLIIEDTLNLAVEINASSRIRDISIIQDIGTIKI